MPVSPNGATAFCYGLFGTIVCIELVLNLAGMPLVSFSLFSAFCGFCDKGVRIVTRILRADLGDWAGMSELLFDWACSVCFALTIAAHGVSRPNHVSVLEILIYVFEVLTLFICAARSRSKVIKRR